MSSSRAKIIGRCWEVLETLHKKKHYVHELAKELGKSDAAVSPCLRALKEEGLIDFEKGEGRRRYYRLRGASRDIVEVIKSAQEPEKATVNEEEFKRLLDRIQSPETRELALEGLREMSTRYTLKSDRLVKKVFKLLKKEDGDIPAKMYRIFKNLCYEARKEGSLDDKLISKISTYVLNRIRDDLVTKEEKIEQRDLWIILGAVDGSDEIIQYCIDYARTEPEQKYKEEEEFIRETLKSAIRNEKKREEVRQKLWNLIKCEKEETIKNRYETFLRYNVGLYKGALSQNTKPQIKT